jgi:non-heme Fe2+,alpha-ketoglutarate-dependent halogenase
VSETLDNRQVQQYHKDGILFPLPALNAAEVAYFRQELDGFHQLLSTNPAFTRQGQCHLRYKWACDLAIHPKVLDAVEDIIGPDILIHSSTFFSKKPNDQKFVSWHQDSITWGLSSPCLVSAWIALTDSTIENGCLRVLPATQNRLFDHSKKPEKNNLLSTGLTVAAALDTEKALDIVLQAGEMSLHHANIIHCSQPNKSTGSRMGFAIRYVSPSVQQQRKHHNVILARGKDHFHYYNIQPNPTAGTQEGLAAQAEHERQPDLDY